MVDFLWLIWVGILALIGGGWIGIHWTAAALAWRAEELGLSDEYQSMIERLERGL